MKRTFQTSTGSTQRFIYLILFALTIVSSCSKDDDMSNELSLIKATASTGLKAYAKASTIEGTAPLDVAFSGSTSIDKWKIAKWNWTFGDGNRSGNKNPKYTFTKSGTYKVTLSIRDDYGNIAEDELTIVVSGTPESKTESSGNYPSNAIFASSFGFNSSDATEALTTAIQSGKSYVVIDKQSSDWVIRPTKFFNLNNMTIVFEEGVVLRAKSGAFPRSGDELFQMVRANNVTIKGGGATFKMGNQGGHGLALSQCNGIKINGLTIRDSGGDGIYITGSSTSGTYSQDITIDNVIATNNSRHGMSIISAQNVWIKNSEFLKSNGSTTEVGVDLEPNDQRDRLVNINFSNCTFADNDSSGFVLGTRSLTSSSTPISITVKNSEFRSNDLSPDSSRPRTQLQLSQGNTVDPVRGEILFENVQFNNSKNKIIFSKLSAKSYMVNFKDCVAKRVSTNGRDPVIILESLSAAQTMGGFTFDNFHMEYESDVPFMRLQVPYNDVVKDIRGSFTIKEPNNNPLHVTGGYNTSHNQNVSINYSHVN